MKIKVFGLNESAEFAHNVAEFLGDQRPSALLEKRFEDGEAYVRSDENVRGMDVYVISSLYSGPSVSAAEKLTSLLTFVGSLKDASAARVTAVCPYLCYARQDRKTESRAPITTKYIAKMFEAVGVDRVLTMDVHNLSAFQNAFRVPTDNLEAKNLFVDWVLKNTVPAVQERLAVLTPDAGGMSRSRAFRAALEKKIGKKVELVYLDKERKMDGTVTGTTIVGNVVGKYVVVVDDLISTGKTMKEAKDAIEKQGADLSAVCATHFLGVGEANEFLKGVPVIVTNSIPPFRMKDTSKLHVLSTCKLFGQAIKRTHEAGGSISEMPVYCGAMKVFRIFNLSTGSVYGTEYETLEQCEAAIHDGEKRGSPMNRKVVKAVTLQRVLQLLDGDGHEPGKENKVAAQRRRPDVGEPVPTRRPPKVRRAGPQRAAKTPGRGR
jgi:ribose-phosphate pyrophosphokinase